MAYLKGLELVGHLVCAADRRWQESVVATKGLGVLCERTREDPADGLALAVGQVEDVARVAVEPHVNGNERKEVLLFRDAARRGVGDILGVGMMARIMARTTARSALRMRATAVSVCPLRSLLLTTAALLRAHCRSPPCPLLLSPRLLCLFSFRLYLDENVLNHDLVGAANGLDAVSRNQEKHIIASQLLGILAVLALAHAERAELRQLVPKRANGSLACG